MTRYYSHHHSAHNPPEVQARPPEQVQHLCAGRPAHQGDGKTITQILKTKTPDQDTLDTTTRRGKELREAAKVWIEIAESESRINLMRRMIQKEIGFADIEEFGEEFKAKLKSV